jgi:hypothetical protein
LNNLAQSNSKKTGLAAGLFLLLFRNDQEQIKRIVSIIRYYVIFVMDAFHKRIIP